MKGLTELLACQTGDLLSFFSGRDADAEAPGSGKEPRAGPTALGIPGDGTGEAGGGGVRTDDVSG